MSRTLTATDRSSLEFGEPYRYQCPHDDCEAHIEGLVRRRAGQQTEYTSHGERDDPAAAYYCDGCQTALRTLLDKKTNELVHVGTTFVTDD